MENGPFEDVFPIKHGDIPASYGAKWLNQQREIVYFFYENCCLDFPMRFAAGSVRVQDAHQALHELRSASSGASKFDAIVVDITDTVQRRGSRWKQINQSRHVASKGNTCLIWQFRLTSLFKHHC